MSSLAKQFFWMTEWLRYSLLNEKLYDLGRQLGTYYGTEDPVSMPFSRRDQLKQEAQKRFMNMDLFFVKVRIS